jgi:hypothetical protein
VQKCCFEKGLKLKSPSEAGESIVAKGIWMYKALKKEREFEGF